MEIKRLQSGCNMYTYFKSMQTLADERLARTFRINRFQRCQNLYKRELVAHFGCVNALEFSKKNMEYLASGGDDKRILLWNIGETLLNPNYKPTQMSSCHVSNIFCVDFNANNQYILSAGNDERVMVHDIETGLEYCQLSKEGSIFTISTQPQHPDLFLIASEDGKITLLDIRHQNYQPTCMADYPSASHGVMFSPTEPFLFATANSEDGAALWDMRKPKLSLLRYGFPASRDRAMCVRFNKSGSLLSVLRRKQPVRIYATHCTTPVCDFTANGYLNSCTMKSGCFAGENDEYIVSGSDDFQVYIWKIPEEIDHKKYMKEDKETVILKGHRSIVNQVRYNSNAQMLVSSGVEKSIKMWSPIRLPQSTGSITQRSDDPTRALYTRNEYLRLVLETGSPLAHDYTSEDTVEDPRMMAFFDSLLHHDMDTDSSGSESSELSIGELLHSIDPDSPNSVVEAEDITQETTNSSTGIENERDLNYSEMQEKICRIFTQEKKHSPLSTWKNVPHLKRLLEICLKMAEDEISMEELKQFIYFYDNEHKPEHKTFKTEQELNNKPGPSYNVLTVQEILAEIKNENADVGEAISKGNCVKFQKLTPGNENCRGKCEERTIPSSDGLSSTDEETKSNMRLRNAKRKRKAKKWIPRSNKTEHSIKITLNDHNTSATICTTLNLSNTATSSKTDENRTRDISASTCVVASTQNQSGIGKTAFERSIEKLNHSIEVTNNRLASFAECLAQAIEDSENNTDDNNNNNQTVS